MTASRQPGRLIYSKNNGFGPDRFRDKCVTAQISPASGLDGSA